MGLAYLLPALRNPNATLTSKEFASLLGISSLSVYGKLYRKQLPKPVVVHDGIRFPSKKNKTQGAPEWSARSHTTLWVVRDVNKCFFW